MEISPLIAVREGPVTRLPAFALNNGTDARLHGLERTDDPAQIKFQKKRQSAGLAPDAEWEPPNGRFLLHSISICGKTEHIPVTCRREVKFPIP